MQKQTLYFQADDNQSVFYHLWTPDADVSLRGLIQIVHGLAEHSARYETFARFLTSNGYVVFANDHRGHGQTAGQLQKVGYFEDRDFWKAAISDVKKLQDLIITQYPNFPIFLFGHSMGALLSRQFITLYGNQLSGAILSATAGDPGILGQLGIQVSALIGSLWGKHSRSSLMTNLSFGKFNTFFKPNRTEFDWLSRDHAAVDKYIQDEYCGQVYTAGFWNSFLKGIAVINQPDAFLHTPGNLPIYLFAGEKDPVGDMGKGVVQIYNAYKKRGIKDLSVKLYPDGRHEMLNEINRQEVYEDILNWLVVRS